MSVSAASVSVSLGASGADVVLAQLKAVRAELALMQGYAPTLHLTADVANAKTQIAAVHAEARLLTAQTNSVRFTADTVQARQEIDRVAAAARALTAQTNSVRFTADAVQARQEIDRVNAAARLLTAETKKLKVEADTSGASKSLLDLGALASSVFAGFGAGELVRKGLDTAFDGLVGYNARLEQTRTAFTQLLGSASAADAFISKAQQFARTTPFQAEDVNKYAIALSGAGVVAKDILPDLNAIGDAVASTGGGKEEVASTVRALDQMRNSVHLNAQDMNQLIQAGINGWALLAGQIGKTQAEVRQMSENGQISGVDAANAIIAGMQQKYAGMMDAQSKTLLGRLSNLKDDVSQTLAGIGADSGLFNDVGGMLDKASTALNSDQFKAGVTAIAADIHVIAEAVGVAVDVLEKIPAPVVKAGVEMASLAVAIRLGEAAFESVAPKILSSATALGAEILAIDRDTVATNENTAAKERNATAGSGAGAGGYLTRAAIGIPIVSAIASATIAPGVIADAQRAAIGQYAGDAQAIQSGDPETIRATLSKLQTEQDAEKKHRETLDYKADAALTLLTGTPGPDIARSDADFAQRQALIDAANKALSSPAVTSGNATTLPGVPTKKDIDAALAGLKMLDDAQHAQALGVNANLIDAGIFKQGTPEQIYAGQEAIKRFDAAYKDAGKTVDSVKLDKGIEGLVSSRADLDQVATTLHDIGGTKVPGLDDLRTLADIFGDIAKAEDDAKSAMDGYLLTLNESDKRITTITKAEADFKEAYQAAQAAQANGTANSAQKEILANGANIWATLESQRAQIQANQAYDILGIAKNFPDEAKADSLGRQAVAQAGGGTDILYRVKADITGAQRQLKDLTDPKSLTIKVSYDYGNASPLTPPTPRVGAYSAPPTTLDAPGWVPSGAGTIDRSGAPGGADGTIPATYAPAGSAIAYTYPDGTPAGPLYDPNTGGGTSYTGRVGASPYPPGSAGATAGSNRSSADNPANMADGPNTPIPGAATQRISKRDNRAQTVSRDDAGGGNGTGVGDWNQFSTLSYQDYLSIVADGAGGKQSPFATPQAYQSLMRAAQQQQLDPRVMLAWTKSENNNATNISPELIAAHNYGGIQFAGQAGARDAGFAEPGYTRDYAAFQNDDYFFSALAKNLSEAPYDQYHQQGGRDALDKVAHTYAKEPGSRVDDYYRYQAQYPGTASGRASTGSAPAAGGGIDPIAARTVDVINSQLGKQKSTFSRDFGQAWAGFCEQLVDDALQQASGNDVRFDTAQKRIDAARAGDKRAGTIVSTPQVGDLVGLDAANDPESNGAGHIGVYTGNGQYTSALGNGVVSGAIPKNAVFIRPPGVGVNTGTSSASGGGPNGNGTLQPNGTVGTVNAENGVPLPILRPDGSNFERFGGSVSKLNGDDQKTVLDLFSKLDTVLPKQYAANVGPYADKSYDENRGHADASKVAADVAHQMAMSGGDLSKVYDEILAKAGSLGPVLVAELQTRQAITVATAQLKSDTAAVTQLEQGHVNDLKQDKINADNLRASRQTEDYGIADAREQVTIGRLADQWSQEDARTSLTEMLKYGQTSPEDAGYYTKMLDQAQAATGRSLPTDFLDGGAYKGSIATEDEYTRFQRKQEGATLSENNAWTTESRKLEDGSRLSDFNEQIKQLGMNSDLANLQRSQRDIGWQRTSDEQLLSGQVKGASTNAEAAQLAGQLAKMHDQDLTTKTTNAKAVDDLQVKIQDEKKVDEQRRYDLATESLTETRKHEDALKGIAEETRLTDQRYQDMQTQVVRTTGAWDEFFARHDRNVTRANQVDDLAFAHSQTLLQRSRQQADDQTQHDIDTRNAQYERDDTAAKAKVTADNDSIQRGKEALSQWQSVESEIAHIAEVFGEKAAAAFSASIGNGGIPNASTTGAHAAGGQITTPYALVGERGPELIRAPGYHVFTADQTNAMLRTPTPISAAPSYGAGGGDVHLHIAGMSGYTDAQLAELKSYVDGWQHRARATNGRGTAGQMNSLGMATHVA